MGRLKSYLMEATGEDFDLIPEMQAMNKLFDGLDLPIVDDVEGYSNECNN